MHRQTIWTEQSQFSSQIYYNIDGRIEYYYKDSLNKHSKKNSPQLKSIAPWNCRFFAWSDVSLFTYVRQFDLNQLFESIKNLLAKKKADISWTHKSENDLIQRDLIAQRK